jgi:uncharacterized protein (DUF1778 family)
MTLMHARGARNERIYVRLTAEEASYIADAAAERSVTMSNFIRDAVLKGSGFHTGGNRRVLARNHAETVRNLNVLGVHLRKLADAMRVDGTVAVAQIDACLAEMCVALGRFEP